MKLKSFAAASIVLAHASAALAQQAPATAPAPAVAPAPAPAVKPSVLVVLKSDDPRATLERRTGTQSPVALPASELGLAQVGIWEQACMAPCEVPIDPHYTYRVAGDGLVPSEGFALPRDRDAVQLDADMGSAHARLGGFMLMGLGAMSMLAGGGALVASPYLESHQTGSETFRTVVKDGGYAAIGLGVLTAGVGLYLVATNGTSVKSGFGYEVADAKIPLPGKLALTPTGLAF